MLRSQVYGTRRLPTLSAGHLGSVGEGYWGPNVITLRQHAEAFAAAMYTVDAGRPVALNRRSKQPYLPGIGPHTERDTVRLVAHALEQVDASSRQVRLRLEDPYPNNPRTKCDLVVGADPTPDWAVEAKMLRLLGDNGKPNDNMLMHVISPYPKHRSAITDCLKLAGTSLAARKCLLIFAYDHPEWPARPALDAFEVLVERRVVLLDRADALTGALVHPVHKAARVAAWEIAETSPAKELRGGPRSTRVPSR